MLQSTECSPIYAIAGSYIDSTGCIRWCDDHGRLHCEVGPALELPNGCKYWYHHGQRHRMDGPAIEYFGKGYWYYHGKRIECFSQEEFERLIKLRVFW